MRQKKENYEEVNTAGVLDGINKVLKNRSLTIFLAIAILALLFA